MRRSRSRFHCHELQLPRTGAPSLGCAVENLFIVERISAFDIRIRLAGRKISEIISTEAAGLSVEVFFSPESISEFADILQDVFLLPCSCELTLRSSENGSGPVAARMILLPLYADNDQLSRLLGCLVTTPIQSIGPVNFHIGAVKKTILCQTELVANGFAEPTENAEFSPPAAAGKPVLVQSSNGIQKTINSANQRRRPNLKLIEQST